MANLKMKEVFAQKNQTDFENVITFDDDSSEKSEIGEPSESDLSYNSSHDSDVDFIWLLGSRRIEMMILIGIKIWVDENQLDWY